MAHDALLNTTKKTALIPNDSHTLQHLATLIAAATECPLSMTRDKTAAIHHVAVLMADHLAASNPPPNPK